MFYLWPVIVLFLLETSYVAIVYMIGVGVSGIRHYFNIVAVIEETGTMRLAPGKSRSQTWLKQSRLTDIVNKISTDKSKRLWLTVLGVFGFIFVVLLVGGLLTEETGDTGDDTTLSKSTRINLWSACARTFSQNDSNVLTAYLPEWYYLPQMDNTQYPSW